MTERDGERRRERERERCKQRKTGKIKRKSRKHWAVIGFSSGFGNVDPPGLS